MAEEKIIMGITDVEIVKAYIRMCNDGWLQGWHERNGGNLTYRMTDSEVDECRDFFSYDKPWVSLGVTAQNLAGEFFIATGSGKYFRNVILAPQDNICIAQISENGDAYRVVWGLEKGGRPTSEFPSHLMNHSVRKTATGGNCRVIYHAHTPGLIALTYVLPLTDRDFTRALWQSATECPVVFPGGVGVVQWMVPGGADIAMATSRLMKKYDAAVWAHHGLFCSGPDFDTTFGLMHTIEKAADIYVRVLSCGHGIRQTISDDNLRAIAKEFGVTINEDFLD
jgi:rhamnulose-1-phosphate aldolase